MQYQTTTNKYGAIYAEHFGAWYPVRCDICRHCRIPRIYDNGSMIAITEDASCAFRSGLAMIDIWYFRDHDINPFVEKPSDCESFTI